MPCLKAWAESLGGITFPLLSDFWPHGEVAKKYGVLRSDGTCERAIFVIDKDGVIRYIDIHDIDDQPSNAVLFQELGRLAANNDFSASVRTQEEESELPHGGVVMYCTRWCPDCKKARTWLKSHNVPYVEVDIESNIRAAKQVRQWASGFETTPTFDIDGTIVVAFDEKRLAEVLKVKSD